MLIHAKPNANQIMELQNICTLNNYIYHYSVIHLWIDIIIFTHYAEDIIIGYLENYKIPYYTELD